MMILSSLMDLLLECYPCFYDQERIVEKRFQRRELFSISIENYSSIKISKTLADDYSSGLVDVFSFLFIYIRVSRSSFSNNITKS